jgi:AcrR family transcriptional regulator
MRRLGKRLRVEAMSLYNHVANKDEILDGIVGVVASEIDLPSDAADWKTGGFELGLDLILDGLERLRDTA